MKTTTIIAGAALTALLLAACGTAPADEVPDVGDPDPSLTWTVDDCEGDAPILCVTDGDRTVGTVEYVQYPSEGDTDLRARVADFHATFEADRGAAYGPDHTFGTTGPAEVSVAGLPGLRYGFTITAPDGTEAERHVNYMTLRGDTIHVASASGYAVEDNEYLDFMPQELQLFEPRLDAIVAERPLPPDEEPGDRVAMLGDGEHLGYVRQIDLDMAVIMLDTVEWVDAPGETPEWRIDDPDDTAYLGRLSPSVSVTVIDCRAGCEPLATTIGELAGGAVKPFNGEHALFDLVVADGLVQSIDERYVP